MALLLGGSDGDQVHNEWALVISNIISAMAHMAVAVPLAASIPWSLAWVLLVSCSLSCIVALVGIVLVLVGVHKSRWLNLERVSIAQRAINLILCCFMASFLALDTEANAWSLATSHIFVFATVLTFCYNTPFPCSTHWFLPTAATMAFAIPIAASGDVELVDTFSTSMVALALLGIHSCWSNWRYRSLAGKHPMMCSKPVHSIVPVEALDTPSCQILGASVMTEEHENSISLRRALANMCVALCTVDDDFRIIGMQLDLCGTAPSIAQDKGAWEAWLAGLLPEVQSIVEAQGTMTRPCTFLVRETDVTFTLILVPTLSTSQGYIVGVGRVQAHLHGAPGTAANQREIVSRFVLPSSTQQYDVIPIQRKRSENSDCAKSGAAANGQEKLEEGTSTSSTSGKRQIGEDLIQTASSSPKFAEIEDGLSVAMKSKGIADTLISVTQSKGEDGCQTKVKSWGSLEFSISGSVGDMADRLNAIETATLPELTAARVPIPRVDSAVQTDIMIEDCYPAFFAGWEPPYSMRWSSASGGHITGERPPQIPPYEVLRQKLMVPTFAATPVETCYKALILTMLHWNLPTQQDCVEGKRVSCCPRHCATRLAKNLLREMSESPCDPEWRPGTAWQCAVCFGTNATELRLCMTCCASKPVRSTPGQKRG